MSQPATSSHPAPVAARPAPVATTTLDLLAIGGRARLVAVGGETPVRRRLLEMGFCAGVTVDVVRRAPLGDPTEFMVRGYHVSLRADQARLIQAVALA